MTRIMFPMFVHEPTERMLLLSMKLTGFSLMRTSVLAFSHSNKATSSIWSQIKEVILLHFNGAPG